MVNLYQILPDERAYIILDFKDDGLTLENISDIFGITKERVRQIIETTRRRLYDFDGLGQIVSTFNRSNSHFELLLVPTKPQSGSNKQ